MARIWTPALAVGIESIDKQHQELFTRAEALMEAMSAGKGGAELSSLIDYLDAYVREHFGAEERVMAKLQYPGTLQHKQLHTDFIRSFEAIKARVGTSGVSTSAVLELNRLIGGWLVSHIGNIDTQLARFLRERKAEGQV